MAATRPWKLYNVPGDGNCFYYALYGAAKHHGLLESVERAFDPTGESNAKGDMRSFARGVRQHLVHLIDTNASPEFNAFIDTVCDVYMAGVDKQDQEIMKRDLGKFASVAAKDCPDKNAFWQHARKIISTSGEWATNLEVDMIRRVLADRGIVLIKPIITSDSERTTGSTRVHIHGGKDVAYFNKDTPAPASIANNELQLVHHGENHYMYLGYGGGSSTISSKSSRSSKSSQSKYSKRSSKSSNKSSKFY